MRIHFEDHGQDFLSWTLDDSGRVIACDPFQASVWVGCHVANHRTLMPGDEVRVAHPVYPGGPHFLRYRIVRIDDDDELPPCLGEAIRDTTYDIYRRACGVED